MKELITTVTNTGQLTLPDEVRAHLGIRQQDKVTFVIEDTGTVTMRVLHYPDLTALRGAAGTLPQPLTDDEIDAIVADERAAEYRRSLEASESGR